MDMQLSGKRALVTGSSSGIGAAIAKELAAEGVWVAVHGRDRERTEKTAAEIVQAGGRRPIVTVGNLVDDKDVDAIGRAALEGLEGVDILVNNAGGLVRMDNPDWSKVTSDEWVEGYRKNVVGALRLIQQLVPGMARRNWGRIVNISSISGSHIVGNQTDYGAAKAALNNMTVSLAKALGKSGITVNAISPGTILTPAVDRWLETLREQLNWGDDFEENQRRYTTDIFPQAVPRLGKPREIATMVAYLASPLAGYMTGTHMRIDGGFGCAV
jgi:3-oxoacyl-[acyl-carrier protein] reductase